MLTLKPKASQAAAQRARSILKHASMFEYTKKGNSKRKKLFFNFFEKGFLPLNILMHL